MCAVDHNKMIAILIKFKALSDGQTQANPVSDSILRPISLLKIVK